MEGEGGAELASLASTLMRNRIVHELTLHTNGVGGRGSEPAFTLQFRDIPNRIAFIPDSLQPVSY